MARFQISNQISGFILGEFDADTAEQALDVMAQDAGYRDQAHALEVLGGDGSDLLVVEVA